MYIKNNLKLSLLALLLPMAAVGQANLYIAPGTDFYFFGNATIYGDVENHGNLGSAGGNTVTFYGASWKNGPTATFPASSGAGATFQFVQPRPAPYANNVVQSLDGGYSTGAQPSFPSLEVNNPNNVNQINTNTRVKNSLIFTAGKVVMNSKDLVLGSTAGNGGTGTITGYDQNKYVVSNLTTGHLVKESYTGSFIYPLGMSTSSYTPAKIVNNIANGMHVNVSDYASYPVAPRTSNDGVDRTWNIYADNATGNSLIDLQHNAATNQVIFREGSHFVTRFVGTTPNTAGDQISYDAWEKNNPAAGLMPGTLTTGAPIATASERDRAYTSFATVPNTNSAYYTKASGPLCLNIRAYVEGALMDNGGAVASDGRPLMRDNLRNSPFTGANYIPANDPYEFATPYQNVTGSYTKLSPQTNSFPLLQQVTNSSTVFGVTGQNAIVDWAFIELRNKSNNAAVFATRAALLQRDGDVVEVDGKSCLSFPGVAVDSYYVAVRHRSHLGTMTKYGQSVNNMENLIDFTVATTPLFDKGTVGPNNFTGLSQKDNVVGTYRAMWQGDFDANRKVKYAGSNNDNNILLGEVLDYPTNTALSTSFDFAYGYFQGDYNMDSKVKFSGTGNDQNLLLGQVLDYPLNATLTTGYDFLIEQLP